MSADGNAEHTPMITYVLGLRCTACGAHRRVRATTKAGLGNGAFVCLVETPRCCDGAMWMISDQPQTETEGRADGE